MGNADLPWVLWISISTTFFYKRHCIIYGYIQINPPAPFTYRVYGREMPTDIQVFVHLDGIYSPEVSFEKKNHFPSTVISAKKKN
jgi:hypothetical protein